MKKRLLYYEIEKRLEHKNVLVITGMRQVGKTTLMKQVFDSISGAPKIWFDFENPLDQKVFEDIEYRNIHSRLKSMSNAGGERMYVFIDEVQNFPEATKVIKYLLDHFGTKFAVTGSSNFYLKNLFPESLSGRKFLYVLPPLSFRECLYFKDKISKEEALSIDLSAALGKKTVVDFQNNEQEFSEYLQFGGFPEVVTTAGDDVKKQILKNIFASFFEKDLKILTDHQDIRELRDLILLLVPRVGSMLDVSKVASEVGVNRVKIYSYLEFLQGTFFIKLLPKYSKSIDRSVAGGKKVYFADTGILNAIGKVNDSQLFENAVINQLAGYGELSFYNKRNTAEIDAILDKETAFEIKLNGTKEDAVYLRKLSRQLGITKAFVISRNYRNEENIIFPMFL